MGCCKSCQISNTMSDIIKHDIHTSKNNQEQLISAQQVYNSKKEIQLKSNSQISDDSDTLFNISQEIQDIQIHDNVRNCSLPYQFQESTEINFRKTQLKKDFQKCLQQQKKKQRNVLKNQRSQFYSPQIQKREPLFVNMLDIVFCDYNSQEKQRNIRSILKKGSSSSKNNSYSNSFHKRVKFARGTSFRSKSASQQNTKVKDKFSFRQIQQINQ